MTQYQYGANNPILFIDVNGDSLNVAQLRDYDANANKVFTSDLQSKSGLTLSTDENGNVTYATDSKGKAVVTKDENGNKEGSRSARKALIKLINSEQTVSVAGKDGPSGPTITNGNTITFNIGQTERQMNGVSEGLNSTTYGYALTFFHEVGETKYGGHYGEDPPFSGEDPYITAGINERLPNKIRRQLVGDYGQRASYASFHYNGKDYMPWSSKSRTRLLNGLGPREYILAPISPSNYPKSKQ